MIDPNKALCEACENANATHRVGLFTRTCEPCADKALQCEHEDGWQRHTRYDADGCGFFLQRCNRCSADIYDDMP